MSKISAMLLLLGVIFAATTLAAQSGPSPSRVYADAFIGPDATLVKSMRSRAVDQLSRRGVVFVESTENADVVLSATGLMQTNFASSARGRSSLRIRGAVRLVKKNGVTLWSGDVISSRYALNESSSFLDKLTEAVTNALAEEEKRNRSEPSVKSSSLR
jgi:hypothetical protein